ncbi:MAG: DNA starvation/stationary phase protection protein [Sphingorhabdus sp.]|nr:DNA starvation/stationary phase protection protein [Sphingorhabdus sp.]
MDINIGIDGASRERSAGALKQLLADTYTLYLKTHGYHWNVEGPHFQQLHLQFMDQYTEMWNAVDSLAERIRALGHYAPSSYSEMGVLSSLKEEDGRPAWQEMVRNLAAGHEQVANTARKVLRVAQEVGDEATADVVTPRLTLHEKTAWMLRATAN